MSVRLAHAQLRERRLGGESVFFDSYSGETHYLDGLAGAIMRRVLHAGEVELETLYAELTGPQPQDPAVVITPEAVRDTAQLLERLGLVRVDHEH